MAEFNRSSSQYTKAKEVGSDEDKRVEFSEDEEMLIARMFKLVGKRWSLIAGRIPGRTAEEIEKYWTSRHTSLSQSSSSQHQIKDDTTQNV